MGLPGGVLLSSGVEIVRMEVNKVDILAIGVHPDDVELSCSGTLLKHIDQGLSLIHI